MVMVSVYGKLVVSQRIRGSCRTWLAFGPGTGIAQPVPQGWSRCRLPLQTHEKGPIGTGGVDPYRTVRIQCESGVRIKKSRIRIQESGSGGIRLQFGMIRGSGPRPDPESFAFSVLMNFFTDPDPRIRDRVRVTHNSFRKNLNMIFQKKKADPRLPLSGSVHIFYLA